MTTTLKLPVIEDWWKSMKRSFTLIELMIVIAIISIITAIAIPNILEARKSGNEAAAIGALKTIQTAQELHKRGHPDEEFGDLNQLKNGGYIDSTFETDGSIILTFGNIALVGADRGGYRFGAATDYGSVGPQPAFLWIALARPIIPGNTGDRYFATNQQGVILFTFDPTGSDVVTADNSNFLPSPAFEAIGK